MGALLGLRLMPRNEGRGSQLWGGKKEGREEKEKECNMSGELGKVGERQMCFQKKRKSGRQMFSCRGMILFSQDVLTIWKIHT